MKKLLMAVSALAVVTSFATLAQAQCPANSLRTLGGPNAPGTYVFNYHSVGSSTPIAAIGYMDFKIAGANTNSNIPSGTLIVTETYNSSGNLQEFHQYTGRYQVSANCKGGVLQFSNVTFDFFFDNSSGVEQLVMVSTTGAPNVLKGIANPQETEGL